MRLARYCWLDPTGTFSKGGVLGGLGLGVVKKGGGKDEVTFSDGGDTMR